MTQRAPAPHPRPLKILYHHRIASKDGQSHHMTELIAAFRRAGHDIKLVGPASFEEQDFGGEVKLVGKIRQSLPAWLYELMEVAYNGLAFLRLLKAYRDYRPDLVYERYNLFLLAGYLLRFFIKRPLYLEINGPLYEERKKYGGISIDWLAKLCQRIQWAKADRALPVTGVLGETVRAQRGKAEGILVIPNGIDPAHFATASTKEEAKARLGLEGKVIIGFTGFVRDWNKLDSVIDFLAEQKDPSLHLLIVGDGPAAEELRSYAKSKGLGDQLTITGVVGRTEILDYLPAFDISVIPGVTPYASPLKLFEYMALGQAVVAPDCANIREVLKDGESAILFGEADPESFRTSLARLTEDKALRQEIAEKAQALVEQRPYSWDDNAQQIVDDFWAHFAQ